MRFRLPPLPPALVVHICPLPFPAPCSGERWKELYHATARAINARCPRPWDFDDSSIFAHIDAFLQRCSDLLEACEAQLQWAPTSPLPVFGGTKGPEIHKSIVDIQASFQKLVSALRTLSYNILDVKATRWHDDFNVFKGGIKDLEVMLTNVIQMAFDAQVRLRPGRPLCSVCCVSGTVDAMCQFVGS